MDARVKPAHDGGWSSDFTLLMIAIDTVTRRLRLAFVVSHPIQYYAPLYQRLAEGDDISIKVFFTWHAGQGPVLDHGFNIPVAWDIPLTAGYEFEVVPNISSDPETHHFLGLNNPALVQRITSWKPDFVHITGWAWLSHLRAMRAFHKSKIPILFRGDSHLLDDTKRGFRWRLKHFVLKQAFSWPSGFLAVGTQNHAYYRAFGVRSDRLFPCPHSIDVGRFAEPAEEFEQEASRWRRQLAIGDQRCVLLFAGKFEKKQQPLALMRAVLENRNRNLMLVLVGSGELECEVKGIAAANPDHFRVLPFENQSRMPVVYRLGDLFVLPSSHGETWGLAVNEAMACGRPVLVSDGVGCAADVVNPSCGRVFEGGDPSALCRAIAEITGDRDRLAEMGRCAAARAWSFDISKTEETLLAAIEQVLASVSGAVAADSRRECHHSPTGRGRPRFSAAGAGVRRFDKPEPPHPDPPPFGERE
jgi:glycosyltransferase involved in cell wall biosynthesis